MKCSSERVLVTRCFLNHSNGLRSRASHGDPEASGRVSNGWPRPEGAGNGQEPNRIGYGAIANDQGSRRKYATVAVDRVFRLRGQEGGWVRKFRLLISEGSKES
jgi:hypothetical protein